MTPTFREEYISQIPAIQFLINLGWKYLSPEQALIARGGRTSNVLLETILRQQLKDINRIQYREREYLFSEANINAAILAIRDLPIQEGFIHANKFLYELITLGKSFEQTIDGDKKSYSLQYIDWKNPGNNVFHVTEEFSVLREGRNDSYRPDLVLFVNGIPLVVIECKSPRIKKPISDAVSQQLTYQQLDGIRSLYHYSGLLAAISVNEALYATTGTTKDYWSVWKEVFRNKGEEKEFESKLLEIKNQPLPPEEHAQLFESRFAWVWEYFKNLGLEEKMVTEQDRALWSLCRPERLLDLIENFTIYEDGDKKIARYQQYNTVRRTLDRIAVIRPDGARRGGVIWHTQGSGKSLTMVMLAQLIARHPSIPNPRIVLVTDRVDLDDQISDTFKKCKMPVVQATKGASAEIKKKLAGESLTKQELEKLEKDDSLLALLDSKEDHIITTVINKFEAAVKSAGGILDSPNIFLLVDEGHRTQYGNFHVQMRRIFQNACFIAFTGTPLMRKEKSTAIKFGGIIQDAVYTIRQAVEDKAVVPLLYEGRHNLIEVNEKPLDAFFSKVMEDATEYGKASVKRKFSTRDQLNKAEQVIYDRAWDISAHFADNFQGKLLGLKGQLVAPNKLTAVKYKRFMDEIGKVNTEVLISPPNEKEGTETAYGGVHDQVLQFWISMMDKHGTPKVYEKNLIHAFKKSDYPEILIVVDKLLTGFDAPRNTVMYLTRQLKEHSLLQAIARVNRLYPGKEYGFIIDYFGNLENLDQALNIYTNLNEFDSEDLESIVTDIKNEIEKLPQAHSEVWDIFQEIKNKYDEPAYEELLSDEEKRHNFYERVSKFARLFKLAQASFEWAKETPEELTKKYKNDAKFFLGLRVSVKRRYSDDLDLSEYEPQIQKLIDTHITTSGEILKITDLVNIFDKEQREAELEKLTGQGAKADHIASRTLRAINVKMDEDPVFYKKLSELIRETIKEYHEHRISEAEFLLRAKSQEETFLKGKQEGLPEILDGKDVAVSFFNQITATLSPFKRGKNESFQDAAELSLLADACFHDEIFDGENPIIDWQENHDLQGKLKIALDDIFFDYQSKHGVEFDLSELDELIEGILKVAKIRYVKK